MDMEITFPGGKRVDASYKGFTIKTDQSLYGGGEGSAPEPFTLFLASLGTCAGIYVLSFCQQRNIDTKGMKIIQRMERDPEARLVGRISLEICLPPAFPEKYRTAVIRAAGQCTVERNLKNPPEIEILTSIADDA